MRIFFKHIFSFVMLALLCGTLAHAQTIKSVHKGDTITHRVKFDSTPDAYCKWTKDGIPVGMDNDSVQIIWEDTDIHTLTATPFNGECQGEPKSLFIKAYGDTSELALNIKFDAPSPVCAILNGSAYAQLVFKVTPGSQATTKYEGDFQVYFKLDTNVFALPYPQAKPFNTNDTLLSIEIDKFLLGNISKETNYILRITQIVGEGIIQTYNDANSPQVAIKVKKIPSIEEIKF